MPHACFLNKHKKHSNLQFSSIVEKKILLCQFNSLFNQKHADRNKHTY